MNKFFFSELADEIMMAQAAVFILGSIETSSSTLSYCLHELAYHPEEQVTHKLQITKRTTNSLCLYIYFWNKKQIPSKTNARQFYKTRVCCQNSKTFTRSDFDIYEGALGKWRDLHNGGR